MATYAIGDVQGCFLTLEALLRRSPFEPTEDRLWLVGDLVNRGPRSLEVLRWARDQGERVVVVLGNHDLHLLAVAAGARRVKARDTLQQVLEADDADALIDWLRRQPLIYLENDRVLVHAGIPPDWGLKVAQAEARAVERRLQSNDWKEFLRELYAGEAPRRWREDRRGRSRARYAVAALTRMRVVEADGALELEFKGPPDRAPAHLVPWFEHPARASAEATVVFGHWAALGLYVREGVVGLDSGCVWGRSLTAYRLEDGCLFQEPNRD